MPLGRHYKVEFTEDATGAPVIADPSIAPGLDPYPVPGMRINLMTVNSDTTLTELDSGKVILVGAAPNTTRVISLPRPVKGLNFLFIVGAYSAAYPVRISPRNTDILLSNVMPSGAYQGKDAINVVTTPKIVDRFGVVGDGGSSWYVTQYSGTWNYES